MADPLTIVLACAALAFLALWLGERLDRQGRSLDEIRLATREYRLAMAFIAAGKSYPYEALFANAVLHGHPAAITRHFPDWPAFRAREIERDEASEP